VLIDLLQEVGSAQAARKMLVKLTTGQKPGQQEPTRSTCQPGLPTWELTSQTQQVTSNLH